MTHPAPLPSLSVLRCFEAAAKYESFTSAAKELGLTQGAVSRQVKELEDQIGAALFLREGRGIRLTRAGQVLAQNLHEDMNRLRRTMAHAYATGETQQLLSIAVLPTFAARWLLPRMKEFKDRWKNLDMIIHSRSDPFDLIEQGVDLAIHFGRQEWPGAQLTPLCPEDLVIVAAPDLLAQYPVKAPRDILHMPLLHMSSRPMLWTTFQQSISGIKIPVRKGSYFDQFTLIISAAVHGLGAAILPTYLIEPELAGGTLISLQTVENKTGQNYYVATPLGISNPIAAEFLSWIRKKVSRKPIPE